MYKHCNTEESVLRQRQLENCLMEMMRTIPFHQITIGHICDRAGISRKSFYRYFSSKEGCLFALIDHHIIDGASFYLPDQHKGSSVRSVYERLFAYWKEHAVLLEVLEKNDLVTQFGQRMVVYITEEEQDFRFLMRSLREDAYEYTIFMVSGIVGLLFRWHKAGYQKSCAQMANILENLIRNI